VTPKTTAEDAGQLIAAIRTRAVGAGIDPNEYEDVTGNLADAAGWTPACNAAAAGHLAAAQSAALNGYRVTAAESYLAAARWAHFATCWPNPDRSAHAAAARQASAAYRQALGLLDPAATWVGDGAGPAPFSGVLRRPGGGALAPLVLLVCGLDSGKEEFHYVAEALLARGLAVFAFDGPGQGELSGATTVESRYERVMAHVLDVLAARADPGVDLSRTGAVGLSLGGFYVIRAAVAESRVAAAVTVSGVTALPWDDLPAGITATLAQRAGGEAAARAFAGDVDAAPLASSLRIPLLVVAGGQDPIPAPQQARAIGATAPRGQLLFVEGGDHLLANRQWQWIGSAADWLAARLASPDLAAVS